MDSWIVLVSRPRRNDRETSASAQRLASLFAGAGLRVLLIPPLYDIPADHALADRLKGEGDGLLLCSELPVRAGEWTLRRMAGREDPASSPPVLCLRLGDFASPEACLRGARDAIGPFAAGEGASPVEEIRGECPPRWYPVLDYSRCTACGRCAEFCLFGVYESDERLGVEAVRPDACKDGCPACARLCPRNAIMFPQCDGDPLVSGEADPDRAEAVPDAQESAYAERRRRQAVEAEDLDRLAAELDDLDI